MAVRVQIHATPISESGEALSEPVAFIAVVNTGYETETPELIVPIPLAQRLGYWPPPVERAEWTTYRSVSGDFQLCRLPRAISSRIPAEDRETPQHQCDIATGTAERRVLISDRLASLLKVDLVDPGEGKWRFRDDPPDRLRDSEPRQLW